MQRFRRGWRVRCVGEIADGLHVDLNQVPKKYDGLDGTELAISESQERMAVDVAAEDVDEFLKYAAEENLEAVVIATVTEDPRMVMEWNGEPIVDLSREFLASNAPPSIRMPTCPAGLLPCPILVRLTQ